MKKLFGASRFGNSLFVLSVTLVLSTVVCSCKSPVNTVANPHFTTEGYCCDTLKATFSEEAPKALGFFVEVSGSMNGFFRANKATRFKEDVWSIVSNFGGNDVFILSNAGEVSGKYSITDFRTKMNSGSFVSNKETHVPTMLESILDKFDYSNGECAVLISDMKYSPERQRDRDVLLTQYQATIREVVGKHPNLAMSLVMAKSDYLSANGAIMEESSPYYYLILGKDTNVAFMRNRIAIILESNDTYGDCIEFGFDYKAPAFAFGVPNNAIQLDREPTFIGYDTSYSDTCKIMLNIDLSDYRWIITDEELFRESFSVNTCYGSKVSLGKVDIDVDNHFNKQFKRKASAKVELKVYNMYATDSDVVEWTLSHPEFKMSQDLVSCMSAGAENDYSGSFSLDKFVAGAFNAIQNKWNTEPNRILISKTK